jgi:flagellar basal-body rod protein FlgG
MVSGLKTSAAAMDAQNERLSVLANNLANVGTVGFKADGLAFFQLLTSPRAAGSVSPTDPAAPPMEAGIQARIDFDNGAIRDTGNPLDVALESPGFFAVGDAKNPRLTRAGNFTRGESGQLETLDGKPVLSDGRQPIQIAQGGRITIDETGDVLVDGSSVGRIGVFDVKNRAALTRDGGARFVVPQGVALTPAENVKVKQGGIEQSNVNPVVTLVEMIDALRVYEAASKAAKGIDETLSRAVGDVGRTS